MLPAGMVTGKSLAVIKSSTALASSLSTPNLAIICSAIDSGVLLSNCVNTWLGWYPAFSEAPRPVAYLNPPGMSSCLKLLSRLLALISLKYFHR